MKQDLTDLLQWPCIIVLLIMTLVDWLLRERP